MKILPFLVVLGSLIAGNFWSQCDTASAKEVLSIQLAYGQKAPDSYERYRLPDFEIRFKRREANQTRPSRECEAMDGGCGLQPGFFFVYEVWKSGHPLQTLRISTLPYDSEAQFVVAEKHYILRMAEGELRVNEIHR